MQCTANCFELPFGKHSIYLYIYIHPKSHNIIYLLFPIYDCDCLMPRPSRQNFLQRFATWLVAVTSSQRGNGSVPQGFLCLIASPAKNQNVSACENQELRPKSFSSSTSSVAWSPMWSNPKWICARLKLRAVCKTPHCNHVGELRLDFSAKSLPWRKTWIEREKVGDDRENSVKNVKKNLKFPLHLSYIWNFWFCFSRNSRALNARSTLPWFMIVSMGPIYHT